MSFSTFFAALMPARRALRFKFSVPLGTLARTAASMAFTEAIGVNHEIAPSAIMFATISFLNLSRAIRVNGI